MAKKKENLTRALKKYFGFDKFKGDQEAIVQNVLDGNDTFVLMPTGRYGYRHITADSADEESGGCHQFYE